jgi:hypothetical protein
MVGELAAGGVLYEPALAVEAPVCWGLNEVCGGGGGVAEALGGNEGPKRSSKDLSETFLVGGGEANAPIISVLAVRRKKGLLALEVEAAGLAI